MKQIRKTSEQRLRECETHLYFLWDAQRLYVQEPDRYKQIATELRVLVGDHKPKRRLLLMMMQEYTFNYQVQPPGPPFDKQPIPLVGWRNDPVHQALAQEVQAALGDEEKMIAVLEKQTALRRPIPFPEYIEKGLAVYIEPYDYSYSKLVRDIAQQVGSSHEAYEVNEPLVQMQNVILGNEESHIAVLIQFADLVIRVGFMFIEHVVQNYGYKPKYFRERAT